MTLQQKVPEAELVRSEYIRCEFRSGAKLNDAKVQRCLRQLQKVPESLQEIIAKEGVYIVFFDGPMTGNPEMARERGKPIPGWEKCYGGKYTYDHLDGIFLMYEKAILIGIDGDYAPGPKDFFLHELGHSFDYLVGAELCSASLSATHEVSVAVSSEPFAGAYFSKPYEYLAQAFQRYYIDKMSNRELRKKHPRIHRLLYEIEKKAELAKVGSLGQTR